MLKITVSKYQLKFNYFLNENGEVFSQRTNKKLSTHLDKDGYEKVRLVCTDGKRHTFSVHRLMLENFCPREDMRLLQVNHVDGNKLNNALYNLEWCTCEENIHHAVKMNLRHCQKGENNNAAKLSEQQVKEIIDLLLDGRFSSAEIGRMYGVCEDYANSIRRGEHWRYLTIGIFD